MRYGITGKPSIQTVEEYISWFPDEVQLKLNRLRKIINQTTPSADERLAWGVSTHYQRGFLAEFTAFGNHIGFYRTPPVLEHFKKELEPCKTNTENTIQIHMGQPLPEELIERLVCFWLKESGSRFDFVLMSVCSRESPVTCRRIFVLLQRM